MLFDGKGNYINDDGQKTITTSVLGADLPSDITSFGITQAYATAMKSTITAWMSEYAGDKLKVPFIVHTDQHGLLNTSRTGLFNLLSYLVPWNEVSGIFNLGDTVTDHWEDDDTNPNTLLRNAQLETALVCLSGLPKDKRIEIPGNHDTWYKDVSTNTYNYITDRKYVNPYFNTVGLRTVRCPDNQFFAEVFDDKFKIRYLVIGSWDYEDRYAHDEHDGYQWFFINQTHWDWIIEKLTENTGYDTIIVSHVPINFGSPGAYDPITNTEITNSRWSLSVIHGSEWFAKLFGDRKNKLSGTLSTGALTLTYDFTNCTDNLLCAFAGHTHFDGVCYLPKSNNDLTFLQIVFDRFVDNTIHFGLIDRRNSQIQCWKLEGGSINNFTKWTCPFDPVST